MATAVRNRVAIQTGPDRLPVARARSCHSLVVRLSGPVRPDSAAALSIWHETVAAASDDPAAAERLSTEAGRPLNPVGPPVRAVVLHYTDGPADLVLVARRTTLGEEALRDLATRIVAGNGSPMPLPAAAAISAGSSEAVRPETEWGIGDTSRTGRTGTVPVELKESSPSDAVLTCAVALVLARHAGTDTASVALLDPGATGVTATVHAVPLDETRTADAYLAQWRTTEGAAVPPAALPAAGVVFGERLPGIDYRPYLAPVLPVVVHWQRDTHGTVEGVLAYDEGETDPEVARSFAAQVAHVAHQLAEDTGRLLADISLLTATEALDVLHRGITPAPAGLPEGPRTIHGLLAEVTRSRPDAVAVVEGDTRLTYAELDRRAAEIAAGLVAVGTSPGSLVGVALDRTAELIVTLLGILKAGAVYVPMDIRYPEERLRYTVTSAEAATVIGHADSFPRIDGVRVVSPDELRKAGAGATGAPAEVDGEAPAYVIYTSGSTGRPKGVVVPHGNVAALVDATRGDFGLGESDVWTFFHSSAFDFSVWEIWACLLTGGRLVVVPYWVTRDTELFYELLVDERVTVLNQTPSAFAQLIEADGRIGAELSLRLVVFGGEPLDVAMLTPWFARHSHTRCRLSNMFGITETTVHVTEQTVTPADITAKSRSVGRAMPGWSLSVRDPRGRILPYGAPGEIYVGGAGVAHGYLGQPELTGERFIDDPYGSGRVYRSGDRGRLRPDGRLDHLGRLDNQVKVRGHRIELDEIRNVMLSHTAVSAAAVLLRYETPGDPATARIDAYVALTGGAGQAEELRGHARGLLPDYMVPATFTVVPAIPLTINGKVDTAALPEPSPRDTRLTEGGDAGAAAAPAEDQVAEQVLDLWSRILNTEVGPGDNFFELGGNSLLVIRLLREMRDRGLPRVSTQDFYRNSVATQFIELVRGTEG
ncbi:amino acid adenylation domain-containing protein [Streptomyces sp. NPDC006514]|uniref:amino acid adenylation domain-containing protein n=1 Tax=Streptomyces sp. NPDC006514 TaxID=3154308 RepID=UPI0033B43633